jgi:hypothetical protein
MAVTKEFILEKYEKLTYKKKVNILLSALSFMQQYNGRSTEDCIELAMREEYDKIYKSKT